MISEMLKRFWYYYMTSQQLSFFFFLLLCLQIVIRSISLKVKYLPVQGKVSVLSGRSLFSEPVKLLLGSNDISRHPTHS